MPTIDEVRFPGVPTSVQDMWKHIIRANMACLNSSETYTELSDKLYGLKTDGIGDESIRWTIEWFLKHNDNIALEDNCFQFLLSNDAKMFLREYGIVDLDGLCQRVWDIPSLSSKIRKEIVFNLNIKVSYMKKMFLFICLVVTLAACERDAENKAESSLVGTTWTREFTASHWLEGAHTSIYYTVHDYVVFTSETEMLRDVDGYDGYSEHYRYTLDGTDLTLEYVKGKTSSGSFSRGTYVGESLILYSHGGSPYVYEKSGIK